jgi:hypothetical protein
VIEVGCWAHGRRYFHKALGSDPVRAAFVPVVMKGDDCSTARPRSVYSVRVRPLAQAVSALMLVACAARDESVLVGADGEHDRTCAAEAYREQRRTLNFCVEDADCVEIVPEPCLSSYYANVASASAWLRDVERDLAARCGVADTARCVRRPLGPPRCRRGRCTPGRLAREERRRCSSMRLPLLELGRPTVLSAGPRGTPAPAPPERAFVRVDESGEMTLQIEAGACGPYELFVDRPPSSWERLIPRATGAQTVSLAVEPGEYRMFFRGLEVPCTLSITATLRRADGSPVAARYHGLRYTTDCE